MQRLTLQRRKWNLSARGDIEGGKAERACRIDAKIRRSTNRNGKILDPIEEGAIGTQSLKSQTGDGQVAQDRPLARWHAQFSRQMAYPSGYRHVGVKADPKRVALGTHHQIGVRRSDIETGSLIVESQPRVVHRKALKHRGLL